MAKTEINLFLLGWFKPQFKPSLAETCHPIYLTPKIKGYSIGILLRYLTGES